MNKVAYEQKEKDVLKLPYSTRYQALNQEKIRLKKIEIAVPVGYQDKIKKRLQPNKCFVGFCCKVLNLLSNKVE